MCTLNYFSHRCLQRKNQHAQQINAPQWRLPNQSQSCHQCSPRTPLIAVFQKACLGYPSTCLPPRQVSQNMHIVVAIRVMDKRVSTLHCPGHVVLKQLQDLISSAPTHLFSHPKPSLQWNEVILQRHISQRSDIVTHNGHSHDIKRCVSHSINRSLKSLYGFKTWWISNFGHDFLFTWKIPSTKVPFMLCPKPMTSTSVRCRPIVTRIICLNHITVRYHQC